MSAQVEQCRKLRSEINLASKVLAPTVIDLPSQLFAICGEEIMMEKFSSQFDLISLITPDTTKRLITMSSNSSSYYNDVTICTMYNTILSTISEQIIG